MSEFALVCRGFASPYEPFSEAFLEAVVVMHARELVRRFLELFGERIGVRTDGLVPALESWLSEDATFDDVWDASFGRLRLCLENPEKADAVRAGVAAALRIAERGGTAEWEARLERPTRLLLERTVLPAADRIGLAAGGGRIEIRISRGAEARTVTLPSPTKGSAGGCESLPSTDVEGVRIHILTKEAWDVTEGGENAVVDRHPKSIVWPLEKTLRLVARHSPPYFDWVRRVVRRILPLEDDPNMMTSSTAAWRPGVLYSANRPDPAALAEMLIHEGSHQYMYVLTRLGPLDDGSDRNLYYSPVSRKMRPLGVIVLAYHAVANITLFCGSCPSGSQLRPRQTEKTLVEALAVYEEILLRSRALTAVGEALWQPLYERLHAVGARPLTADRSRGRARKGASGSYRNRTVHPRKAQRTSCPSSRRLDRAARMTSRAPSSH